MQSKVSNQMFSSKKSSKFGSMHMAEMNLNMQEKSLFTLCYLLSFQVKKFIGLFEMLKHEKHTDQTLLSQIEKVVKKFGIYFQNNFHKLKMAEGSTPREQKRA
jgi:hypothetical protein